MCGQTGKNVCELLNDIKYIHHSDNLNHIKYNIHHSVTVIIMRCCPRLLTVNTGKYMNNCNQVVNTNYSVDYVTAIRHC